MECGALKSRRSCFVLLVYISINPVIILLSVPGYDNIFAAKLDGDIFCSVIRDNGSTIKISIPEEKEASCLIMIYT